MVSRGKPKELVVASAVSKSSVATPREEDKAEAHLSGKLKDKRVIVQGLGNVGYHAA